MPRTPRRRDAVDAHVEQWLVELPDLDPLAEGVVTRMQRIVRLLAARRRETLAAVGLPDGEYVTLHVLVRRGAPHRAPVGELATELLVSPAAMTTRVDGLEAAGLVRRIADPADRRRVVVELTPAGRTRWRECMDALGEVEDRMVSALPPAEVRRLDDALRTMLLEIEGEPGG